MSLLLLPAILGDDSHLPREFQSPHDRVLRTRMRILRIRIRTRIYRVVLIVIFLSLESWLQRFDRTRSHHGN